jgi:hypothetical protein
MEWSKIELKVYSSGNTASGWICLPSENISREISVSKKKDIFVLKNSGIDDKVKFTIR